MSRVAFMLAFLGHYLRWLAGRSALPAVAPYRSDADHRSTVEALQQRLRTGRPPFSSQKHTAGHQARWVNVSDRDSTLDFRPLRGILGFDADSGTITVEPQVTIRQLLRATIDDGWAPAVLPEFPEITVGGAIQGLAAESTCHRHGLFHESVASMEVLLGDGTHLQVTPDHHPELWRMIPGSYGTVAAITAATLRLAPALPWVEVNHRRQTIDAFIDGAFDHDADAVDAVAVDDDTATVTTARWIPAPPANRPRRRFRRFAPYYADHVTKEAAEGASEIMSFEGYAFRFDRGAFWIAPTKLGRGLLSRALLADFATAANLYRLRRSRQHLKPGPSRRVVQDCILPHDRVSSVLGWVRTHLEGPIWLLPILTRTENPFGLHQGRWINLGIYLRHPGGTNEARAFDAELEERVIAAGGRKTLHAEVVDPAAYLEQTVDMAEYRQLRHRFAAADAFPDLVAKLNGAR